MKIILDSNDTYKADVHAASIDVNTTTANVVFSSAEFDAVLEYDNARQHESQKIIIDVEDTPLTVKKCHIFPIRLNNAVESGDVEITELEITSTDPLLGLYYRNTLLKAINFRPKHLHIRTLDYPFDDAYDCIICAHELGFESLINKYRSTIDKLTLHFGKVDMVFFREAYKELARCAINTPLNISLTAEKDKHNIQCESIPEYNNMQESINFINNCRHYSKEYGESLNTINDNTRIYEKIKHYNPRFIKNFSQCKPLIAKKLMGSDMYNAFLLCYINDSAIVKALSECCYNYTQQRMHLPDDVKECIVKHIGGITELDEIDKALKHDNITTDQQD